MNFTDFSLVGLSFDFGFFEVGITPEMHDETTSQYQSLNQLVVRRFFRLHLNEPWMAPLLSRMEQEEFFELFNKKIPPLPKQQQGVMSIFPPITKDCTTGFKDRNPACLTGVKFLWDLGQVVDKELNPDTFSDILDLYSTLDNASEIYEESIEARYDVMENPGVQVNIVYSAMHPTLYKQYYNQDPRTKTSSGQIYVPDKQRDAMGDGAVLAASALGPGIKWADQFRRGVEGAKPVNLIELCSKYKRRRSIFNLWREKTVTKNAYFGIKCNCRSSVWGESTGDNCNHANMLSDRDLVHFVMESLYTKEKGKVGLRFLRMTNEELSNYVKNCRLFRQNNKKEVSGADEEEEETKNEE